jgi:hypothetical protein
MKTYPELDVFSDVVVDVTCQLINKIVPNIESEMPYKAQYMLEQVIKRLQDKI